MPTRQPGLSASALIFSSLLVTRLIFSSPFCYQIDLLITFLLPDWSFHHFHFLFALNLFCFRLWIVICTSYLFCLIFPLFDPLITFTFLSDSTSYFFHLLFANGHIDLLITFLIFPKSLCFPLKSLLPLVYFRFMIILALDEGRLKLSQKSSILVEDGFPGPLLISSHLLIHAHSSYCIECIVLFWLCPRLSLSLNLFQCCITFYFLFLYCLHLIWPPLHQPATTFSVFWYWCNWY